MVYYEDSKQVMKISRICQIAPLKIRGARGVMRIVEITPLSPPYSKGDVEGDIRKLSTL